MPTMRATLDGGGSGSRTDLPTRPTSQARPGQSTHRRSALHTRALRTTRLLSLCPFVYKERYKQAFHHPQLVHRTVTHSLRLCLSLLAGSFLSVSEHTLALSP